MHLTIDVQYGMLDNITVNVEIFMVAIFRGFNFVGINFRGWEKPAVIVVINSSSVESFVGIIFVGVACPQKLFPSENFCVYDMQHREAKTFVYQVFARSNFYV